MNLAPRADDDGDMARWRNTEEIKQIVEQYQASGMTQGAYCQQTGIAVNTLRRYIQRNGGEGQRLLPVSLEGTREADSGFALVLGNGRRIESGWGFSDADLVRLIRVVEAV